MNAILFYVLAALVVIGAAAAVVLPDLRHAAAALGLLVVGAAALCFGAGAFAVGVTQVVLPVAAAAAALWVVRRGAAYQGLPVRLVAPLRRLWLGAPAVGIAVLLLVVLALSGGVWIAGSAAGHLITVLHYRTTYALMLGVVLAVAGVAVALLIGRTSTDERQFERAAEARRQREERERRRREDREAARRRRGAPVASEDA